MTKEELISEIEKLESQIEEFREELNDIKNQEASEWCNKFVYFPDEDAIFYIEEVSIVDDQLYVDEGFWIRLSPGIEVSPISDFLDGGSEFKPISKEEAKEIIRKSLNEKLEKANINL